MSLKRKSFLSMPLQCVQVKKNAAQQLYSYLQDNTRYVSIQFGIGGFQSFETDFVSKYKIGDCKALTTYMKALLNSAGISSYQVLVRAGKEDFPSMIDFPYNFFNHVILMVPLENDTTWLECTSQHQLFGRLGSFTEGKTGLLLADNASGLIHIPVSQKNERELNIHSEIGLSKSLSGEAKVVMDFSEALSEEFGLRERSIIRTL